MISTKPTDLKNGVKDSEGAIYDGDKLLKFDNSSALEYHVKEGTTIICDSAFWGKFRIQSVVLPDSVIAIGRNAFCGATDLFEINIPEGVTELPFSVFSCCDSLKTLTLPATMKQVGNEALPGGIEVLVLNSRVLFEDLAFEYTNLQQLVVPDAIISYYENVKSRFNLSCEILPLSEWDKADDSSSEDDDDEIDLLKPGDDDDEIDLLKPRYDDDSCDDDEDDDSRDDDEDDDSCDDDEEIEYYEYNEEEDEYAHKNKDDDNDDGIFSAFKEVGDSMKESMKESVKELGSGLKEAFSFGFGSKKEEKPEKKKKGGFFDKFF